MLDKFKWWNFCPVVYILNSSNIQIRTFILTWHRNDVIILDDIQQFVLLIVKTLRVFVFMIVSRVWATDRTKTTFTAAPAAVAIAAVFVDQNVLWLLLLVLIAGLLIAVVLFLARLIATARRAFVLCASILEPNFDLQMK